MTDNPEGNTEHGTEPIGEPAAPPDATELPAPEASPRTSGLARLRPRGRLNQIAAVLVSVAAG
ncbi:MAG: hypothetical protein QOH27_3468, partial [Mycobacterium sp.]|nr:hypothetical protein [Mycobacterium sp.]